MSDTLQFEVESLSLPTTFTIVRRLDNVDRTKIPVGTYEVFQLRRDLASEVAQTPYVFVKIQQHVTDTQWESGVVFLIGDTFFGLVRLPRETKYKDIACDEQQGQSEQAWTARLDGSKSVEGFSMRPPSKMPHDESPRSSGEPATFLFSRYYKTLYSLHTPLNYFPKTTLTRVRNLCDNNNEQIRDVLLQAYISVGELDARHEGKYGLLRPGESFGDKGQYEEECRRDFMASHDVLLGVVRLSENFQQSDNSPVKSFEAKLSGIVMDLKMREAQLQMLLILELLTAMDVSEDEFIHGNLKRHQKHIKVLQRKAKRSLVRRHNTKRTVIPTFVGLAVEEPAAAVPREGELDDFALYNTLNTLIDRLEIWDTVRGRTGENDGTLGFLGYVVVPYFNKKLPQVVKYIIDKLKAPRARKEKKKDRPERKKHKSERFPKQMLAPDKMPLLQRASTDADDLKPAFTLRRSKSSLSSKNLQRRQVDMSVTKSELVESKSFIFGDARKVREQVSGPALLAQVQATPSKPKSVISATPSKPKSVVSATPSKPKSLISATPSTRDKDAGVGVMATPRAKEFGATTPSKSVVGATPNVRVPQSLPFERPPFPFRKPTLTEKLSSELVTSPEVSSPVATPQSRKRRPGEPVSVQESPFFTSKLLGSPFSGGLRSTSYNLQQITIQSPARPQRKIRPEVILSPEVKTQNQLMAPSTSHGDTDEDSDELEFTAPAKPSRTYGRRLRPS